MSDSRRERYDALDPPKPWTQSAYPTPAYTAVAEDQPKTSEKQTAYAAPGTEAERRAPMHASARSIPARETDHASSDRRAQQRPATFREAQPVAPAPAAPTASAAPIPPAAPTEARLRREAPSQPPARHARWKPYFTLIFVLIALALVYISGVLDEQLQQFDIPTFGSLRATEEREATPPPAALLPPTPQRIATTAPTATPVPIVPAIGDRSLVLVAFTADPVSTRAPASVTFELKGSADIQSIRLMTENNEPLSASVQAAPWEDGRQWRVTMQFDTPYQGAVIVYLRDENGQWTLSPLRCTLDVH